MIMNNRHKAILFALAIPAFISGASVFAADVVPDISLRFESMIQRSSNNVGSMFRIADEGQTSTIILSGEEYPQVIRAAKDLGEDVKRVTGTASPVEMDGKTRSGAILIGTVGKSPLIDSLIKDNKLNVDAIKGKWESYLIQVNNDALVIAGSDKRGTAESEIPRHLHQR